MVWAAVHACSTCRLARTVPLGCNISAGFVGNARHIKVAEKTNEIQVTTTRTMQCSGSGGPIREFRTYAQSYVIDHGTYWEGEWWPSDSLFAVCV